MSEDGEMSAKEAKQILRMHRPQWRGELLAFLGLYAMFAAFGSIAWLITYMKGY